MFDTTVWLHLCMKFFIAHFPVISRSSCSDMSSHIALGIAITGGLKTVFISALKNRSRSISVLYYNLLLLPSRCVRYISTGYEVLRCSSVIEINWGVHWVKGLKYTWLQLSIRENHFLLFPIISVRQTYITQCYRGLCMYLWKCGAFFCLFACHSIL